MCHEAFRKQTVAFEYQPNKNNFESVIFKIITLTPEEISYVGDLEGNRPTNPGKCL